MLNDIDQVLAVWLQRIGITPFKPSSTSSPLINHALMHYSWPNAQAVVDAHLDDPSDLEKLFQHCGVPNIVLAQLNHQRIIESLVLHGCRLSAHPKQSRILYQTALIDWIDFDFNGESPIPCPIQIAKTDQVEYQMINMKLVSDRDDDYSLRRDPGFMLCHSVMEYLLWPSENTVSDLAVSLLPYVKWPLTRLLNQIAKAKTNHIPLDFDFIQSAALTGDKVSLCDVMSSAIYLPFDLTPSRYLLVERDYQARYLENQSVLGA